MSTVVCNTPGCENEGVGIDIETSFQDEESDETITVDTVICGACGNQIQWEA